MTSRTRLKPNSEQPQMPLAPLLHRGKPRYSLADLQQGLHSLHLLCCRLLSSPQTESYRPTLHSLADSILSNLELLEDHLISLSADKPDSPSQ